MHAHFQSKSKVCELWIAQQNAVAIAPSTHHTSCWSIQASMSQTCTKTTHTIKHANSQLPCAKQTGSSTDSTTQLHTNCKQEHEQHSSLRLQCTMHARLFFSSTFFCNKCCLTHPLTQPIWWHGSSGGSCMMSLHLILDKLKLINLVIEFTTEISF